MPTCRNNQNKTRLEQKIEHLQQETRSATQINIDALYQLFPQCFTEYFDEETGQLRKAVDFLKLREVLGDCVGSTEQESYDFTWVGKRAARAEAATSINKTLRPCVSESVDWDTTKNLYVEGDNLEVLKLLQTSYIGKVKTIYIDPPYNTGSDFIYCDNFSISLQEYQLTAGCKDESGMHYRKNVETSGRFHSAWCSMIYARLLVARSLLTEDGVILISIDDHEIDNLKKICNEVFGESNFVAQFVWKGGRKNAAKFVSTSHEYMVCFAKNLIACHEKCVSWHEKKRGLDEIYATANQLSAIHGNDYDKVSLDLKEWYKALPDDHESKAHAHYCWVDERGVYSPSDISRGGGGGPRWEVVNPQTGDVVTTPHRGWAYASQDELERDISAGRIHFNGNRIPCRKSYLTDNETQLRDTVFYKDRRGSSIRLINLLGGDFFPFPKDEDVLLDFIRSFSDSESIILDFFSGSATTAHAVMKLNAEDGGKRNFILVQLPECTDEKSEVYKAGYQTICELGKERIRLAGAKIKKGVGVSAMNLDVGFRVFKCDSTNLKDTFHIPDVYTQAMLSDMLDGVKTDRTDLDLLFGCLLHYGMSLSSSVCQETIGSCTIYNVNQGSLIACFNALITEDAVDYIQRKRPEHILFRENSFSGMVHKQVVFESLKQQMGWSQLDVNRRIKLI